MDQNNLFFLALLFILTITKAFSIDPYYELCKEPKHCGNQLIKFPFYIENQQESFCGHPGFMISCVDNQPMLKLPDNGHYIIHQIFYHNHTLQVSNAAFEIPNTDRCFPFIRNTSLPDHFRFTSQHKDIFLLYNCSLSSPDIYSEFRLGCSGGNESLSVLAMPPEDPNFKNASSMCRPSVKLQVAGGPESFAIQMLSRGFFLDWKATNCTECEQSGGYCGFAEGRFTFQCYCSDRPHFRRCAQGNNKLALELGLGIGLPASFVIVLLVCFLYRQRKRKYSTSFSPSKSDPEGGSIYYGVPVFSYAELEKATNKFDHSRELGDGGFGTVYYGKLDDGREVAVKRLYEHNYKRVEQFRNEIEILTRLRHKNLVTLYGCTSRHSRELLLVYEYIPNGTVADHLHGEKAQPGSLTWPTRMSIAIETASALSYLHASDIIHRDVKTNNILLDSNFCVKVADFGLSRLFPNDVTHVSTAPQGTPGYVDPEYHQCYQLTNKSDVYSFGVVLVELISSMPAVDISRHRHEINLSNLAMNKIHKQAYNELVDPTLGFDLDSSTRRMIIMAAELAFRCLQPDKEMRPSMDEVLKALQDIESGKFGLDSLDKTQNVDIVESKKNVQAPPSPECDEVGLLKLFRQPSSPISVNAKWISWPSTPNSSV